jgi:hypothetical protein
MPDLKMDPAAGAVTTEIRILKQQIGVTAVDLWDDTDHNGRPDRFLSRLKSPGDRENQPLEIGTPVALADKVVQWIWMPSQPPAGGPGSGEGWAVEIDVRQNGQPLAGTPMRLAGDYPPGQGYGLYETWFRLVLK